MLHACCPLILFKKLNYQISKKYLFPTISNMRLTKNYRNHFQPNKNPRCPCQMHLFILHIVMMWIDVNRNFRNSKLFALWFKYHLRVFLNFSQLNLTRDEFWMKFWYHFRLLDLWTLLNAIDSFLFFFFKHYLG